MIGEDRIRGDLWNVYSDARVKAVDFAAHNRVGLHTPSVLPNYQNSDPNGDVVLGRIDNPFNQNETMSYGDPSRYNAVTVRIRATAARGQQSPHFFAGILGRRFFDMEADATAAKSFRNLEGVRVLNAENAGVADIVGAATLVASQPAVDALVARARKPEGRVAEEVA